MEFIDDETAAAMIAMLKRELRKADLKNEKLMHENGRLRMGLADLQRECQQVWRELDNRW
jgi:hypothetical protein